MFKDQDLMSYIKVSIDNIYFIFKSQIINFVLNINYRPNIRVNYYQIKVLKEMVKFLLIYQSKSIKIQIVFLARIGKEIKQINKSVSVFLHIK